MRKSLKNYKKNYKKKKNNSSDCLNKGSKMSQFHIIRKALFELNKIEDNYLAREAYCMGKACGTREDAIIASMKKRGF